MSVTLVLVPASLSIGSTVTALIASVTLSVAATIQENKEFEKELKMASSYSIDGLMVAREMNKEYDNQPQYICSEYKTIFKDKNLLIKTVTEHGLQNILEQDGKIHGNIDNLQFEFEKNSEGVYEMHITHTKNDDLSFVEDLNEEYQMNVQEQSYINIKKNLEKQNLKIDSEEILEDNSIMLTVNLE